MRAALILNGILAIVVFGFCEFCKSGNGLSIRHALTFFQGIAALTAVVSCLGFVVGFIRPRIGFYALIASCSLILLWWYPFLRVCDSIPTGDDAMGIFWPLIAGAGCVLTSLIAVIGLVVGIVRRFTAANQMQSSLACPGPSGFPVQLCDDERGSETPSTPADQP